ncbi:alpha/beta fold hydrolase [Tropicimonas sp. IMCC34043]|uniref:alpha/beta fold hydrolase n=1 Tax=Tropicimonas sp. IMCC34043 TaxID=2248760 RepID=UPI000E22DA52|nr:alpha/beta hydrolase [Tropicimonas sp. IMCC34043]
MTQVDIGGLRLGLRIWGDGPVTVVFIHGNLASKDWISLAAPHFPADLRVVGIDWRGCGDSDRPPAGEDCADYAIARHAEDMLAALDALDIPFCHLLTHSTGGIISTRMLLEKPARFGRVLALDPVAPMGLPFASGTIEIFRAMGQDRELMRTVLGSTAAPTLFRPETLVPGQRPEYALPDSPEAALFEACVDQALGVSEGVLVGTPINLTKEHASGELVRRMAEIAHPHLVLLGALDRIIPLADMKRMAAEMPDCRLVQVPGVGHSMNIEDPSLFAGYVGAWFGGLG